MNSVAAKRVFAVSLAVIFILTIGDAKAQLLDRALSLRDLSFQLNTPESIAHFMWHNFSFENDKENFGKADYWQSPESFLVTRKGDCEDFALFAHTLLKVNGVNSFLLNIYGRKFAHTVCVFKENDKYNVIDGTKVIRFEAEDLTKLASQIYPFWKKAAVVKPAENGADGFGVILAEFQKKHRRFRLFGRSA